MRILALIFSLLCGSVAALPQMLGNATLSGRYFFRHVQFSTDGSGSVTDARSALGTITFDGAGGYSVTGQQVIGTAAAIAFTASGAYRLNSAGVVALANPQKPALSINARYSTEAVIGSATDAAENTFDLFVAIPASSAGVTAASLKGNYFATNFELTAASTTQARDVSLAAAFDGAGTITALSGRGHAANFNAGAIVSETLIGATYTLTADGSGAATFPAGTPTTLVSAAKNIYLSRSGNLFIAANPAGHDVMIGVKAITGPATNASLAGRYWQAGLRVDPVNGSQAYSGSGLSSPRTVLSTCRAGPTCWAVRFRSTTPARCLSPSGPMALAPLAQQAWESARPAPCSQPLPSRHWTPPLTNSRSRSLCPRLQEPAFSLTRRASSTQPVMRLASTLFRRVSFSRFTDLVLPRPPKCLCRPIRFRSTA